MSIHVIDEDDLVGDAKDVLSEAGKFNFGDYGAPTSERHYPSNVETIRFADELEFRTSVRRNINPKSLLANLPDLTIFHTTDVIYVNMANPILSGYTVKQLRSFVLHEAYHESKAFAEQSSSIVQGMIASGINIPTGSANIKALERQVEEAIIREAVRDIAGLNRGISDAQYKTFEALFEDYWRGSPLDNDIKEAITRAFHVGRLVEALPSLIDDPLGDSAAEEAARARGNEIYEELLARHGSKFEKYVDEYLTEFIKEFPDAAPETVMNGPIPDSEGTDQAVRTSQRPTQRPDPTDKPNKSLVDAFKDFFGISPTILDFDDDGVEISHIGTVSFDWDNDGFKEQSNWVSPDDGFLVIDLASNSPDGSFTPGDGKID
ncbi:MAG: hypothetical protein ABJN34_13030 [Litoreibacter sp.]|uniref:hypothetical protein n=1 Tax=Litoreibacter sp. TaxID=1969459 RepID=UPI003298D84D